MANEPMVQVPVRILELVARCLEVAGQDSAAGYTVLEDYMEANENTIERRAYNLFNEIDSNLACADGYFAEYFGAEEWNGYERRGLDRWEAMAG